MKSLKIENIKFEDASGTNLIWIHSPKVLIDNMIVQNISFGENSEAVKSLAMITEFYCLLQDCQITIQSSQFKFLLYFPELFNFKTLSTPPATKALKLFSALTPTQ